MMSRSASPQLLPRLPWLRRGALLCACLGLLRATPALAQEEESGELAFLALDEALERMTSVASTRVRSLREAPGTVTVITREEILESGARDLTEVLQRVPGLGLLGDAEGLLFQSVRGLPGDGRILVLLDGQVLNDPAYNSAPLGGRVPVEMIESIDVVRWPAFAIYGETAVLAVIHIHTRGADQQGSVQAWASHARTAQVATGSSVSLVANTHVAAVPGLSASLAAAVGVSLQSDGTYTDLDGASYAMPDASRRRPLLLSAGAEWKGLRLRLVHEDLQTYSRDGVGPLLDAPTDTGFRTTSAEASYALRLGEGLTLTPRLGYRHQLPWRDADPDSALFYDKYVDRFGARVALSWDVTRGTQLVVGTEAYREHAALDQPEYVGRGLQRPFGEALTLDVGNVAAFGELSADLPWVNLTAGARLESHTVYGPVLVPRLALTRSWERLHLKLLASGAFRAPSVEMMGLNPAIEPEHARVLEAEAGYQLTHWLGLTANAFDVRVRDVIVYFYDDASAEEGYRNGARTGSRGLELTAHVQLPRLRADVTYAFATTAELNAVADYTVPGDDSRLLGMSPHSLAVHAALRLTDTLTLAPSLIVLGERSGYTRQAAAADSGVETLPTAVLAHLFLRWQDALGVRGLEAGAGVRNLLGTRYALPQGYAGGHAPMPGPGRELVLRLGYGLALE